MINASAPYKIKFLLSITISLCATLALMGCVSDQSYLSSYNSAKRSNGPATTEDFLAAGNAQNNTATLSPEEMHAAAVKLVNPEKTRGRLAYTSKLKRADVTTTSRFRELNIDSQSSAFKIEQTQALANIEASAGSDTTITPRHSSIINMRLGDYPDKTRLVLDLSSATKFKHEIKNSKVSGNVLLITLSDAEWDFDKERYFNNHPLIENYKTATSANGNVALRITLKKPSQVTLAGAVRPNKNSGHRIFFDVAAL